MQYRDNTTLVVEYDEQPLYNEYFLERRIIMTYKLTLLGNCQASSWSKALTILNPEIKVLHCEFAGSNFKLTNDLKIFIKESDFLFLVNSKMDAFISDEFQELDVASKIVKVPSLTCSAFHPDNGYIFSGERLIRNSLGGDWNSRIQGFAYSENLEYSDFVNLFQDVEFHKQIGFFNLWEDFVDFYHEEFSVHNLDFIKWLQKMRRHGVFMHGINHPKLRAVLYMAEQVLENLGVPIEGSEESYALLNDPLIDSIWPIHSVMGDFFGIRPDTQIVIQNLVLPAEKFYSETWNNWNLGKEDGSKFSIWPPLNTSRERTGII
jgi:hypothetical protein